MSEIMMQLGPFQFGLQTAAYQEFQRSTAYTWAAQARFGQDDTLQSTGPGEDTITLTGIVYPEHWGGTGQLDAMRALGGQAIAHTMVNGRGQMMGDWVIEGVDERGSVFGPAGIALAQEFTIKLRRAPAQAGARDLFAGLAASITGALPASSILNSATAVAATAAKGPAGLLSSLGGSLASITSMAGTIGSQASSILGAVNGGINAAKRLQNAGTDATRSLTGIRALANVPSAMRSLIELGSSVSQAAGRSSSALKVAGIDLSDPAAFGAVRGSMIAVNQLNVLAVNVRATAETIFNRAS